MKKNIILNGKKRFIENKNLKNSGKKGRKGMSQIQARDGVERAFRMQKMQRERGDMDFHLNS